MSGAISNLLIKALSPAYYKGQWSNFLVKSHDFYHPMFRSGSATPLWHAMIGVSVIMYTTSYLARDYPAIQKKHEIQKKALHEYYEKHGGAPDHH